MLSLLNRQTNLKFLNFYKGNVDNQEGLETKNAYKLFQKEYGLVTDGIYGIKTDAKLIEVIKEIQKLVGVNSDGVAGPMTIGATKSWQASQGLTPDGIFGEKSRTRMVQYFNSWDCIKHFSKSEFTCKCGCGLNNIDLKVVKVAEKIRNHYGVPVIVNCGTRCAKHNKEVGGVYNSRHLTGKAIDLYVKGITGDKLLAYCKTLVKNGDLRYTYRITSKGNACHIDIQ